MELIVRSDRELRRIERAIAAFEARPAAERMRMANLLLALKAERDQIVRHSRHRLLAAVVFEQRVA